MIGGIAGLQSLAAPLDDHVDRLLLGGFIFDLGSYGTPTTDILPEWLVGPLPDGNKILLLGDQVEVERILPKKSLGKVVPCLDCSHVKGSEPLECGAGQTLLEQTNQEPVVMLELRKVSTVCF